MKECQLCKKCYTDEINACPDDGMPTFHSISGEPVLEGKYYLEKRLGQGGMGVVYCAKHAYLKTQHAIKIILPDLVGNDPQLVTRFRQEALAAAAIRHHNVVQVTDYGVAQGTMPFLVMEFVEGESLHDLLTREKRLSPERALELMTAICAGIGAAHRQGIVHRDLKPLNIMILKDKSSMAEAIKILDFGLAKIKSGELLGSFIQAQTTGLMGSPYYMAPEQWSDEEPDVRSDIYSLAVMLFQMVTGDVPFKGSSIPAIMKKHLTDQPPTFAELGIGLSPQLEAAIRHALEKDPEKRTPSVEAFIEELRNAIGYTSTNLGVITAPNMAVSSLQILTNPPQSKIFLDNVAVGESQANGWLLLEGLQSGRHHLRVRHEGFQDWEGEVVCDGKTQQVFTKLEKESVAIPKPPVRANVTANTPPQNFVETQAAAPSVMQKTAAQSRQTGEQGREVKSQPKKSFFSPLVLAITGIAGLLLLTFLGVVAAYIAGFIGGSNSNTKVNNVNNAATPTPSVSPTAEQVAKTEMVKITGGKFMMGSNEGKPAEQPAHEAEVEDFWLGKTEVTNAEYHEFVKETGHKAPAHWTASGNPVRGEEKLPVVRVSLADVNAYIDWLSKRDRVQYRLPTEREWEYAARNGGANNLYPWGDRWEANRGIFDQTTPKAVGSVPNGANQWGVVDLIGNVWEWTSSELASYPNSKAVIEKKGDRKEYIIRGGGYASKSSGGNAVTATTRLWVEAERQDGFLGFRLARSD